MPRLGCCVAECRGKGAVRDPSTTLIPFPKDVNLADEWKNLCGLPDDFVIKPTTRICSKHFRTGARSLNPDSEDYVPSVFDIPSPIIKNKRSYCPSCRKVTLTCPCKVIAAVQQGAMDEDEEEESEDEYQNGGDEEEQYEDDNGEQEESEPAEEEEDVPDDGEVMDSDDDDWTPAAKTEAKPRRSNRSRKKRRNASSDSSDDDSGSDEPPPKLVKQEITTPSKPASPIKTQKSTPGSSSEQTADNKNSTPASNKGGRGRPPKSETSTPASNITPKTEPSSMTPASATPTPNKTVGGNRNPRVVTPAGPGPQDEKLLAKIKEMEMDYSIKLERIQRNHNMRFANLKEEHLQTIHRMKIEWELEKANLLSQIEYYKETMNQKTDEEPMNPFNGGQPIIILPAPDHDEV